MGQKVMPTGFRLGITEDWRSRWYSDKDYAKNLANDMEIRKFLDKYLAKAAVAKVEIERAGDKVKVIITTARPGVVIGKKGSEIEQLRKELAKIVGGPVNIEVIEVKRPELDANLVAQSIAEQLEGRVAFRRAMRKAVQSARKSGAASGTAKAVCLCTPCVRRSTTASAPLLPRWVPSASKCGSTTAKNSPVARLRSLLSRATLVRRAAVATAMIATKGVLNNASS